MNSTIASFYDTAAAAGQSGGALSVVRLGAERSLS